MPAKRELSMRQLRHLLRLHHDGVSAREIGRRLGVGRGARAILQDNLKRAAAAGHKWPLADDVAEEATELQLFGRAAIATGLWRRVEPDWAALARELKRAGVTMGRDAADVAMSTAFCVANLVRFVVVIQERLSMVNRVLATVALWRDAYAGRP